MSKCCTTTRHGTGRKRKVPPLASAMMLSLVAVCLALGGTLDARLSQLEERVAALAPGQLETPSHGQHKEDVFKEGAAPEKVTKQAAWDGDGKIYAKDSEGNTCGLEWDGSKSGNERNAKWDCSGSADPLSMELLTLRGQKLSGLGRIYATDWDGNRCGLRCYGDDLFELFNPENYRNKPYERNAKWDCGWPSGHADPVHIVGNRIYAKNNLDGNMCGLEWSGSKSGGERNAKWDCRPGQWGLADPLQWVKG